MGTAWQLFGLVWGGTLLLTGLVIRTEACTSTAVNVTYRSPLVLECEGRAPVSWSSHTQVSSESSREVFTTPINNAGERRSWLAYRSATYSDNNIKCSTGNGSCIIYSVKVYTVPSNVRITDSGLLSNTVRLGNSVTLTCSSSGTEPQYQWKHNGTIIPAATSATYRVTSAQFSAAGQYTCEVSNWAGKSQGTYTLQVQAVPAITSLRSSATSNKVTLPRTGNTALYIYCHVSKGSKPVNFRWKLNGHSVQGSSTSQRDHASEVIGRLHISTLTPSHQGTYTCFTENTVGSHQSSIRVTVVDPPVAQVKVNGSRITSRVVQVLNGTVSRFQCLKNGSTPLTASWSTSVESVDTASVGDDMMLQLTHEEEGNYTCSVNNTQEGLSDQYRLNVLVYDPIHAISSNKSLETNETSSVTMTCAFFKDPDDPDPFPQVNWTGPSYSSVETAGKMSYDVYESSITFAAKRRHYGNFSCSVNDVGVGVMYSNISLKVYYVPEAVDSDTIQVTDKKITSATVQWTQAEDKHYTIHYYHLRVSTCDGSSSPQNCQELNTFKSIDNTTTYTIENLAPFTVYSLEVAAENSVGIGPYSNPVTVQSDGDLVAILTASGGVLVLLLLATALVVILVMIVVICMKRRRRRRKSKRRQKDARSPEKELDMKDAHYTPLDIGKVVESGPYASLRYASSSTEWKEDDISSSREYAVPPDAMPKPVGVSSGCVDSGAPKPVANSTTFRSLGESTNSTTAVGQASSAGKKKPELPKKASRGKKPIPLAITNPANCNMKQDPWPVTQSAGPTTSSGGISSVESPVATKASTAVAKKEKTGKKKQPLSLPASAKHQSATVNTPTGAETPSKLSVAELAKCIEKGN